jgi:hypothetical protein
MADGNDSGGGNVQFDPQVSFRTVAKPFPNFETTYQGRPAAVPIAFPGVKDENAGRPGFDPNLLAAYPVPYGATIWLWIPICVGGLNQQQEPIIQLYDYTIIWRLRDLTSFRNRSTPYHIQRQQPGAFDTMAGQPRFVIPAARQVLSFTQAEPALDLAPGNINLRNLLWTPQGGGTIEPLLPGLPPPTGTIQQGVLDPAIDPGIAKDPIFSAFKIQCQGDEMMILATKRTTNPWDFAGEDFPFSNVYGSANGQHKPFDQLGIYYFPGAGPDVGAP